MSRTHHLSTGEVIACFALTVKGNSTQVVADHLGIASVTVQKVINRQTHANVVVPPKLVKSAQDAMAWNKKKCGANLLSETQRLDIIRRVLNGERVTHIAQRYGVTHRTVMYWRDRTTALVKESL